MRTFGPPLPLPVIVPNEAALYAVMESIPPKRLPLGPTGRRVLRDVMRVLARELSRRGVRAPGAP